MDKEKVFWKEHCMIIWDKGYIHMNTFYKTKTVQVQKSIFALYQKLPASMLDYQLGTAVLV